MAEWESRFWRYVNKRENGCWLWTAAQNEGGYGVLGTDGKKIDRAHRLSWILHHGPIPKGLCVCHHCDVRACVNPNHLFLGTRADNNLDGRQKGRIRVPHFRGEQNNKAKLTALQVAEIRRLYAEGLPPKRKGRQSFTNQLAKRFGIDRSQIDNIASGRQWREEGSSSGRTRD